MPRPDATAVAQRSSLMKLQYQTYWTSPEDDEVNLRWINRFYARVYAASGGVPASNRVTDGCFINYPDVDLPPSWPALYYKSGYPGLQAVKARWDPRNVSTTPSQSRRLPTIRKPAHDQMPLAVSMYSRTEPPDGGR